MYFYAFWYGFVRYKWDGYVIMTIITFIVHTLACLLPLSTYSHMVGILLYQDSKKINLLLFIKTRSIK